MKHRKLVVNFSEINMSDLESVGGKNASLGELRKNLAPLGMNVPDGYPRDAATGAAKGRVFDCIRRSLPAAGTNARACCPIVCNCRGSA